jgi:hypothetical protein
MGTIGSPKIEVYPHYKCKEYKHNLRSILD